MKKRIIKFPKKHIFTLNVNGLRGRMFYMENKNTNKKILYIPDLLSNLDLSWNIINLFHHYGSVTAIDMPGIGNMESFSHINKKPSLDNYADYIASIIKLRYKNKKFTIVANGFGFIVLTRALQKYDDLSNNISLIISINGITKSDSLKISNLKKIILKITRNLSIFQRIVNKNLYFNSFITSINGLDSISKSMNKTDQKYFIKKLHTNDLTNYLKCLKILLNVDNCYKRVNIHLWNILLNDSVINSDVNEQLLKITYSNVNQIRPDVSFIDLIASPNKHLSKIIPYKLKRKLKSK
jgi:hypothetical protein